MAEGRGDDRQTYNHSEIFGAIRDLGRKMDDESRERRGVEAELFREIKDTRKDLGGQIDGVKDEMADLAAAVSRVEGEREGERKARAEAAAHAALHPALPPAPPPATLAAPQLSLSQTAAAWGAAIVAVLGILGGLGQALHTTVSVVVAAYKALSPPAGH